MGQYPKCRMWGLAGGSQVTPIFPGEDTCCWEVESDLTCRYSSEVESGSTCHYSSSSENWKKVA